ncbi:MAG: hypothetical protein JW820_20080 [Spirochaetales bacterium]|nr:hypothetical protein [Spirochaetales bacterium]
MLADFRILFRMALVSLVAIAAGCSLFNEPGEKEDDPITYQEADLTASWTAYNDCVGSATGNAANVTQIDHNDPTDTLLKYADGTSTSIDVTMESSNLAPWNASVEFPAGTDAHEVFAGIVNLQEIASYSGASDWYYQATFAGLDPAKKYAFITTANRDSTSFPGTSYEGSGASSRWTKFAISGADTYANISSAGVMDVSEDVVKMNTGYNTGDGYVVAWTDITAADGTFSVRSENVGAAGPGEPYKSYGLQGFVLIELAE